MKKSFILVLTVLILSMSLMFVGCSTDDDGEDNGGGSPEIPAVLKGTTWVNSTTNEKIEFGNKDVTVTLSGGSPKKYDLDSVTKGGIQYSLIFKGLPGGSNEICIFEDGSGFYVMGFAGTTSDSGWLKQ